MENKLLQSKTYLYATAFFSGMSVMAVEIGASRLLAPYFSASQIVWQSLCDRVHIRVHVSIICPFLCVFFCTFCGYVFTLLGMEKPHK